MRIAALTLGILSLGMGQTPSLNWVDLADTVYGISGSQDTFLIVIQKRSGNVRVFELYDTLGTTRFLAARDSVFLDATGRVNRIRRYERPDNNSPFSIWADHQFSYPGSPSMKIETTDGVSTTIQQETFFYGLTIYEGSLAWNAFMGVGDFPMPVQVYPQGYLTIHYGDSALINLLTANQALAIVRKVRSGSCDTLTVYSGSINNPSSPVYAGKICHTAGHIDSVISPFDQTYWSYNASNRPIRWIYVTGSTSDTTLYTYDAAGRLIETRESGVTGSGSYIRRYVLRYAGAPSSLASELEKGCLQWDAANRRGMLPCKPAGTVTALRLYDLQGRVVWEGQVQGGDAFEIPAVLPAGLYHLRAGEHVVRLYLLP